MSEERKDRFLQQKLDSNEQKQFESDLSHDPEMQEEIAVELGVRDGISEIERQRIRASINAFEQSGPTQSALPIKRYLAVAASMALLMTTTIWYFNSYPDYNNLYSSYHEKYPNNLAPVLRSEGLPPDLKTRGLQHYEQSRYTEAIQDFQAYLEQSSDLGIELYLGLALVEDAQYKKASIILQSVVQANDPTFQETARWYLALTSLRLHDPISTSNNLKPLSEKPGPYQEQARKLLEEL